MTLLIAQANCYNFLNFGADRTLSYKPSISLTLPGSGSPYFPAGMGAHGTFLHIYVSLIFGRQLLLLHWSVANPTRARADTQ